MKMMKRTILILLALLVLTAPVLSLAESDYEKGVGWVFLDGVLTITANGGMEDFFNNDPDQNGKSRYRHDGYDVKSVVIGKNVTQFHMFAFGEDFYPTTMSVESGNSIFSVVDGWLLNTKTKTLICATDLDRFTWMPVARKIPDSVEIIGVDAFYPYNHIIQIHLPDSVTEIGEFTFDACNKLESIQLPPNLKIISRGAFCGCESLRKVDMGMSIESIGEYAFKGCYSLERVNLENTRITVLNKNVFSYTGLKNVVLPDTLQRIEPEAFSDCSSLYSITVCSDDVVFQHDAFADCDKLRKIIFTKGVPKSMGIDLFSAIGETSDGKHFLSGYYESFKKEIPYPTLYYTAEYANQWAPNGETERNGYPIQQLTAKEERALAAKTERHEYTPASESVTDDYEAGDGWVFDSGKLLLTTNQGLVDFTANQMDDSFDYRYSHFPSEVDTIVIGKDVSYVSPVA
ncbi:MAG: leucine-rich repeat domain-containing protein, partial [Clostridiaceae bacterium]